MSTPRGDRPGGGDLVVLDARVRTLDPDAPRANAFAVRDGRVVHVGAPSGSRASAPHAPVLEVKSRTVTPCFTDAHTHLALWARARARLSLAGAGSLEEALARVAGAHARLAPGVRLTGEDDARTLELRASGPRSEDALQNIRRPTTMADV